MLLEIDTAENKLASYMKETRQYHLNVRYSNGRYSVCDAECDAACNLLRHDNRPGFTHVLDTGSN
jgi:hypothetical protein